MMQYLTACHEIIMDDHYTKHLLLENQDLLLHSWGRNGDRFVKLFRHTWDQIPADVTHAILGFCLAHRPMIELSDSWRPDVSYGQVDCVIRGGQIMEITIRFRAAAFACFPLAVAQWVIAHELAHIYEKACGRLPDPDPDAEDVTEERVNKIAEHWGFKQNSLLLIIMLQNNRGLSIADACAEVDRL